ncbi:MAG: cation diffusion facilitator family transporter [Beijerinckiaceae bacterium]
MTQNHDSRHEHAPAAQARSPHGHSHGSHSHGSHGGHGALPTLAAADLTPAFRWAVILNAAYVVIEAAAGFITGSLALLADAAHNLTDVAGLLIAWAAASAGKRPPTRQFTFGYGRSTILAALANAGSILIGVGAVTWEAVQRFQNPVAVPALTILIVAAIGIAVNFGTALLFSRSRHSDLNAEGAYLHMAADAAVSLGVVLAALGIMATGWQWIDPLVAILVSILIGWTAWKLLRASLRLTLDGVPPHIDRAKLERHLAALPGVHSVHDLHIWPLSTTRVAMSAHLVMPGGHPGDAFLFDLQKNLESRFGIHHPTVQIEMGDGAACPLAPAEIV